MTTEQLRALVQGIVDAGDRLNTAAPNHEARVALEEMDRKCEELFQALCTTGLLSPSEAGEAYVGFVTPDNPMMWVEFDGVHRITINTETGAAVREEC